MVKNIAGGGAGGEALRELPLSLPSSKNSKPKSLRSSAGVGMLTYHWEALLTDLGSREATCNSQS